MKVAIVNKADGSIASVYEDAAPNQVNYGGPWGNPSMFVHAEAPADVDQKNGVVAVDGSVTFVDNADKIQAKRNGKLLQLRELRKVKLAEVDLLVNDVALSETGAPTVAALKTYRTALKDFTTPYKYAAEPDRAKAAIDGVDLTNVSWPAL